MTTYLVLYPKLGTNSKRAIARKSKRFGHPCHYWPKYTLVQRLAREMNWTEERVEDQLQEERAELLRRQQINLMEF